MQAATASSVAPKRGLGTDEHGSSPACRDRDAVAQDGTSGEFSKDPKMPSPMFVSLSAMALLIDGALRASGGSVEVRSAVGSGTTLILRLPLIAGSGE